MTPNFNEDYIEILPSPPPPKKCLINVYMHCMKYESYFDLELVS